MSIHTTDTGLHRVIVRGFIFLCVSLGLSGCAAGPIAGVAVSLVSGTVTAAADVTSSVVGTVVDVAIPDSDKETEE